MQVDLDATAPLAISAVLGSLSEQRLLDLSRVFGIAAHKTRDGKSRLVRDLAPQLEPRLAEVLDELGRDELRVLARRANLPDRERDRRVLVESLKRVLSLTTTSASNEPALRDGLPQAGQVVSVRSRQWLVESVAVGEVGDSPLVRLVCLDDDDSGRQLDVLWDLELGARIVKPSTGGLERVEKVDPPTQFGAYLHALKWSAVSAADATRFQAPFRAGIKLMAHQLTPLMKALELPRANLFIADDVGLGKTIEAGLVLQELLLRQQADFVLIVCPASVCLQWKDEMQRRFGLRFEVMTQKFIAYRREDRGFGVNPWSTHNRFIVSYSLLRRGEYKDPLMAHLGPRARKGLLILDEAHTAAPSSASRYAVDSETTRMVRDLAPRFDNRLFLSATPHNGHSNSFSALLELLDPTRFTRAVPIDGKKDLEAVMVRRLKRDLRKLGVKEQFPRRLLVQLELTHQSGSWHCTETSFDSETNEERRGDSRALAMAPPTELDLATKLARYTELCAPKQGSARLAFIHLQQRLLSSPEAFYKSIEVHGSRGKGSRSSARGGRAVELDATLDSESHGIDDEALESDVEQEMIAATEGLPSPSGEAAQLLAAMRTLATKARGLPDAKTLALLQWMKEHQCTAISESNPSKAARQWSRVRVLVFTEYADTKRYLLDLLTQAIAETDDAERRIMTFHGGMSDDARDEVRRAFNAPPDEHPVRILIATDAAREGVNLQGFCSDLFHFDIPWNPSRLEQRNGRIDRTLQPADTVRCHSFVYVERKEDRVLQAVVRKVNVVQAELGSLGAVLFGQIERLLQRGIDATAFEAVQAVGTDVKTEAVDAELEAQRRDLDGLRKEIARAGSRLDASKRALEVASDSLRGVVGVGLAMAGGDDLIPTGTTTDGRLTFALPPLDRSWEPTLDSLRGPRERDESLWDWRQRPLKPVTFDPIATLSEQVEQLHLAHPFVKRILDRFVAQGFGAHDLSRVTAVAAPDDSVVRVIAYARLSLFGASAARLHDEIVSLAAAWTDDAEAVSPYKDGATNARAIAQAEQLLTGGGRTPPNVVLERVQQHASRLFAELWPHLEAEAEARAVNARQGLAQRARRESGDMHALLERQRKTIDKAQATLSQSGLFDVKDQEQKRQLEQDLKHLTRRRSQIDREIEREPAAIAELYEVKMTRLQPVGLVVTWPGAML